MSACPGLWAVVINWNGGSLNLDCLASLVSCGLPPERIVFVDNASDDGSLEGVRAAHGGLVILENESNLGFGAAANQGAAAALEAGAELVVYVNNDLTFEEGCLAALMEYLAERPAVGVVGPRILSAIEPERVWCAGGRLDYRQNLSTLQGFGELDGPAYRGSGPVDYVPGCALMIRREALQTLGGFDAGYFAYMEDVDLCVCARAAGHAVHLVGHVAAWHRSSSSTGGGYNPRRKYMMGVNSVRLLRKHGDRRAWASFILHDILSLPWLLLAGLFRGRGWAVWAKARGILAGLRGKQVSAADASRF
ncbi:MAG: glycosyltransferase family 2 protein [bacterium]|jgi:hypothetical protein|nr:glycosyltransferase family 2 protein [Planctomycetota bacterium]HIL53042.1 glycosyltransferase family 2 protein [Planctomycetota bacterium]